MEENPQYNTGREAHQVREEEDRSYGDKGRDEDKEDAPQIFKETPTQLEELESGVNLSTKE